MSLARRAGALALALALAAGAAAVVRPERAAAAVAGDSFAVDYAGGQLSVQAEATPLRRLLAAIAEAARFRLVLADDLDRPITRSFAGVTLDRGLERLLEGVSYLRTYESRDGQAVLAELRVLGPAAADAPAAVSTVVLRQAPQTQPAADVTAGLDLAETERLKRVRHLRTQSGSDVAQELALYLERDESATVRRIAAAALARQGGLEARNALTTALDDPDAQVRRAALLSLARQWGPEASRALSQALTNDPDAEARGLAARMLGRTGGTEAETALEAALQDIDPKVRQLARQALANLETSTGAGGFQP